MKSLLRTLFGQRRSAAEPSTESVREQVREIIAEGNREEDAGNAARARDLYERAVALAPDFAPAYFNLGNAMSSLGIRREAARCYERALELKPDYADAHFNLATTLLVGGSPAQAEAHYREAVRVREDWADAWAGLGCVLEMTAAEAEAVAAFERALALNSAHAGAATRLASLQKDRGRTTTALRVLDTALAGNPGDITIVRARAEILQSAGEYDAAIAGYRRVLDASPGDLGAWNGLLWTLNFRPEATAEDIFSEHRKFGEMMESAVPRRPRLTVRSAGRRLKVGYVSPDFCRHPVSCFIEPLLRHHDRESFEVHCFHDLAVVDDVTERIRASAEHWHEIVGMSDQEVAERVASNGIDILVDLAGHTSHNRLGLFAIKAAPLQFTWLGYLCTTGLKAIDFRLCDFHTDPPGVAEGWQVETPARLPASQWCYQPPVQLPAPTALPMLANSYCTFGSFNQQSKLSSLTLDTWVRVLDSIPGSRIRIVGVSSDMVQERIRSRFAAAGIAAERIELLGRIPIESYFASYREVDIALDSLPYNGATTTCDALIMGVPVATAAGNRSIARGGVSLLSSAGLSDWIAPAADGVAQMLRGHCADPARLAALRAVLPARLRASALMDGPRFARDVEAIFARACGRA